MDISIPYPPALSRYQSAGVHDIYPLFRISLNIVYQVVMARLLYIGAIVKMC